MNQDVMNRAERLLNTCAQVFETLFKAQENLKYTERPDGSKYWIREPRKLDDMEAFISELRGTANDIANGRREQPVLLNQTEVSGQETQLSKVSEQISGE